jgi:DNA-binding NarL/FixJ family response regulator
MASGPVFAQVCPMNPPITVAIVEDKDEIRQSLAILVNGAEGFACQGTYASAEDALDDLPVRPVDVVLMDIDLPGLNGIECVRQLKPRCPAMQFMICTVYDEDETVFEALKAGANSYILKRSAPHKLLEAIAELHEGGSPMSSSIARKIVGSFQAVAPSPEVDALTARERQILDRLAKGYSHREVADELFISPTTVRKHIFNIYEKLQVHSKIEAVNKYLGRN